MIHGYLCVRLLSHFFFCMSMCGVCLHVCVQVHMCACVEARGCCYASFLITELELAHLASLSIDFALGMDASASQVLGLQVSHHTCPSFHMGARGLNPGPHTCVASTFLAEPSSQPSTGFSITTVH